MLNESGQDVDVDQPHQNDEDLYIAYSIKIMTALEAKQKSHNEENNSKVNISKLKTVFKAAGKNYGSDLSIDINTWCMARVNMYLEMVKGAKSYKKVEKEIFANSNSLDLTESFIPTKECFEAAEKDVEQHDLNLDFKDINNLYLIEKSQNRYAIIEF
tara:strand:- start:372 stop:845 length:474 start_codon:yes stop_codon:yes gene_type:complete